MKSQQLSLARFFARFFLSDDFFKINVDSTILLFRENNKTIRPFLYLYSIPVVFY